MYVTNEGYEIAETASWVQIIVEPSLAVEDLSSIGIRQTGLVTGSITKLLKEIFYVKISDSQESEK